MYAPSHSQILYLFQFAGGMSILTCINSLKITYIPITWLLTVWERFIIQETEKQIIIKDWYKYKYQGVNELYGS
jgi:hypothetical protein